MPDFKEIMREKLRKNVELIKSVVPKFNMTDEEIDNYITDEMVEVYQRHKDFDTRKEETEGLSKVREYLPSEMIPSNFRRSYMFIVKTDGSEESERFNRELFFDINRDNEKGDDKIAEYIISATEQISSIDSRMFLRNVPLAQRVEYAFRMRKEGLVGYEGHNILNPGTRFSASVDEPLCKTYQDYGQTIGGLARAYMNLAMQEEFLTFPFEKMSYEQFEEFMNKGTTQTHKKELHDLAMKVINIVPAMKSIQEVWDNEDAYKNGFTARPVTKDDIHFNEPYEKRHKGGYNGRVQHIITVKERLDAIKIDPEREKLEKIKAQLIILVDILKNVYGVPQNQMMEVIRQAAENVALAVESAVRDKTLEKDTDENVQKFLSDARELSDSLVMLKTKGLLSDLVFYQRLDSETVIADRDGNGMDFSVLQSGAENGTYHFSEQFYYLSANLNSLNFRGLRRLAGDSPKMAAVKNALEKIKEIDGHCSPEQAKAAVEKLQSAAEAYLTDKDKAKNERWNAVDAIHTLAQTELSALENTRADTKLNSAVDSIIADINRNFAEIEENTDGMVSYLDCVMIGGKTLRGLLTEECPGAQKGRFTEADEAALENPDREHVAKVILRAMADGKKAEFFAMTLDGRILSVQDGKPGCVLEEPKALKEMDKNELNEMKAQLDKEVKVKFLRPEKREEYWKQIDNCRRAVVLGNWVYRAQRGAPHKMIRTLVKNWKNANAVDGVQPEVPRISENLGERIRFGRTSIPSFVTAYLLTRKGMKIEDIFDPNAKVEEKIAATDHIIGLFTNGGDNLRELVSIALDGSQMLYDTIFGIMNDIDLDDDSQVYSDITAYVPAMCSIANDLDQDRKTGRESTALCKELIAEKIGRPVDSPEVENNFRERDEIQMRINGVNALYVGQFELARIAEGCGRCFPGVGQYAMRAVQSELMRQAYLRKMKNGVSFKDAMPAGETVELLPYSNNIEQVVAFDRPDTHGLRKIMPDLSPESYMKLADKILSGELRRDYYLNAGTVADDGREFWLEKNSDMAAIRKAKKSQRPAGGKKAAPVRPENAANKNGIVPGK